MTDDEMDALLDAAAAAPKSAASDGQSATAQDLGELTKLDQYRRQKEGVRKVGRGLYYSKLVPPGAS